MMMRNAKYILLAAGLLVVLSVFVAGCGKKSVATINGEAISKEEFYSRLESLQIPTANGSQQAGALVLNQMINEKLIAQIAKEKNATPTEAQIKEKLTLMKKEGALKNLDKVGITEKDIEQQIWVQQAYVNVVGKGEKVTEKEAKEYYDRFRDQLYKRPDQVQIAVIATKEKKKIDEASSLIKKGQEFSTVAMRLSEDPNTRSNGGVAGPVYKGQPGIPTKIIDTAFGLKKGQVSQPFQISDDPNKMWYMIKAMDRIPARTQSFNEVKNTIMEGLRVRKGQAKVDFGKILENYRKKAKIEINDKKYESLKKTASVPAEPTK